MRSYEIYIESVFAVNLILNIFILVLTAKTLRLSVTRLRLLGGASLGAAGYCLILFIADAAIWGLLPVSLLMCKTTFASRGIKNVLRQSGYLFIYAFLCGGITVFIRRHLPYSGRYLYRILLTLLLSYLVYTALKYFIKRYRRRENGFYRVFIPCQDTEVMITALADTGNGLIEPISGKPVMILEESAWEKLKPLMKPEKTRAIPYHNIGNANGMMTGYELKEIIIEQCGQRKKYERVIVAVGPGRLSGRGDYRMLLHPQMLNGD